MIGGGRLSPLPPPPHSLGPRSGRNSCHGRLGVGPPRQPDGAEVFHGERVALRRRSAGELAGEAEGFNLGAGRGATVHPIDNLAGAGLTLRVPHGVEPDVPLVLVGDDVGEKLPRSPRETGVGFRRVPVGPRFLHDGAVLVVDAHLHRRPHALRDAGRDALARLHRTVPVDSDEVALEAEETVGDGGEVREGDGGGHL